MIAQTPTPAQIMVWTRQKLHPDSPLYNIVALVTTSGVVERGHADAAFTALVAHTDALRTVFRESAGAPVPEVLDALAVPVEHVDLSTAPDPATALTDWAAARARRPLDPGRRLFDFAVARLAPDRFAWYLALHHLIADGWSFSVLLTRLRELYLRSMTGRLGEPLDCPRFADYARDVAAYRRSTRYASDEAYWRAKLAAARAAGSDRRPGVLRGTRVHRITLDLGPERTARLEALVAGQPVARWARDVSRLAVFAAVLAAHRARTAPAGPVLIATPIQDRSTRAFKETVGLCTDHVLLRIDVADGATFDSLVAQARDEIAETLRHRRFPVRTLDPGAFDLELNLHTRTADREVAGETVPLEWVHPGHGATAIALNVESPDVSGRDYVLRLDLHDEVFDAAAREGVARRLLRILDGALDAPARPVARIALLSGAEREQALVGWNRTAAPFPADATLPALLQARAARAGDRIALSDAGRALSYAGLHAEANRLARRLRALGVGPEARVGVCLERSAHLVVALLGALQAGAAYLPLEPGLPPERLAYMIEDAGADVVLTRTGLAALVDGSGAKVICLDEPDDAAWPSGPPALTADPGQLAYVMYTSGSTGRPKGVMIPHRGIVNRLIWMQEAYGLGPSDAVLQKTPFGFDVSVWEFFWPLLTGARLVLARPGGHQDSGYLARLIADEAITTAHFVPSMLVPFLREPEVERCRSLRRVISSGEALSAALVERFHARLPWAEIHNLYGPTEASVDVTAWACDRAAPSRPVPIGRPIANTRAYVLDADLEPVPPGAVGELHIGGVSLARGYVGRPDLTAEAFVPDPFGAPGERLYRTGDLARHRPDGAIEFLGRRDHQVKLHGFRVELGEIEAALADHPEVREAAVALAGDEPENRRLVAYVVPEAGPAPSVSDLRAHLRATLPDYMVPSAFVTLDALPLGTNGKLDRGGLPAPGPERPDLAEAFVAPRTPVEAALAGIWAAALGLDRVGVHDNFFDLGGASIQCLEVVSRAAAEGYAMTPAMLFEHQTVDELARALEAA